MPVLTYLFSPIGQALADLRRHWRAAGLALLIACLLYPLIFLAHFAISGALFAPKVVHFSSDMTESISLNRAMEEGVMSRDALLLAMGEDSANLDDYIERGLRLRFYANLKTSVVQGPLRTLGRNFFPGLDRSTQQVRSFIFVDLNTGPVAGPYTLREEIAGPPEPDFSDLLLRRNAEVQNSFSNSSFPTSLNIRVHQSIDEPKFFLRPMVESGSRWNLGYWLVLSVTGWLALWPLMYLTARILGSEIGLWRCFQRCLIFAPALGLFLVLITMAEVAWAQLFGWALTLVKVSSVLSLAMSIVLTGLMLLLAFWLTLRLILPCLYHLIIQQVPLRQAMATCWPLTAGGAERLAIWAGLWGLIITVLAALTLPLLIAVLGSLPIHIGNLILFLIRSYGGALLFAVLFFLILLFSFILIAIQASLLRQAMGRAAVG